MVWGDGGVGLLWGEMRGVVGVMWWRVIVPTHLVGQGLVIFDDITVRRIRATTGAGVVGLVVPIPPVGYHCQARAIRIVRPCKPLTRTMYVSVTSGERCLNPVR